MNEIGMYVDVDDTIISLVGEDADWEYDGFNPYTKDRVLISPIKEHIDILKTAKDKGWEVYVWSHRGVKWANYIVDLLELRDHITCVLPKPFLYLDDVDMKDWPCANQFLRECYKW